MIILHQYSLRDVSTSNSIGRWVIKGCFLYVKTYTTHKPPQVKGKTIGLPSAFCCEIACTLIPPILSNMQEKIASFTRMISGDSYNVPCNGKKPMTTTRDHCSVESIHVLVSSSFP